MPNIYYVDAHQLTVEEMSLEEFLYRFNGDMLDTTECYAYTDRSEADERLAFLKDEEEDDEEE